VDRLSRRIGCATAAKGYGIPGNRRWLRNLSRFLSDGAENYDVAYVRDLRHDAQCRPEASQRRRVAVVLRADNSGPERRLPVAVGVGRRQADQTSDLMKADAFVGTTEIAHRELIAAGYPRDRVHRIVGGVPVSGPVLSSGDKLAARWSLENVNTLLHCPPETPAAVYTGRLDETVGQPAIERLASTLPGDGPTRRLWLVGAGANQSELNRQIDAAGLVGRVVIPGVFADVSELLAAADAAVIGGNSGESHALLLEAMAAGLPIAADDTPLHRSVVGDESCVRLVPGDSDPLGEILVRMFHDVDEAHRMGAAAKALVEREYEIGKVADAHMRLLERFGSKVGKFELAVKKRILEIIPTLDRAGAEKQLTLLAAGLPADEFEVHVCALTRGGPLTGGSGEGGNCDHRDRQALEDRSAGFLSVETVCCRLEARSYSHVDFRRQRLWSCCRHVVQGEMPRGGRTLRRSLEGWARSRDRSLPGPANGEDRDEQFGRQGVLHGSTVCRRRSS
jgi:glycosyltransferase involved in cell wall biosynthesis